MKKRIIIISVCVTVIAIISAVIFGIIMPIISSFFGSSIQINLPARNQTSPEGIDTSNDASVAKLRANYGYKVEGYCEEEADKLREKILTTPNTEELYKITGTKYYISATGDDKNDGLSPERPIKTLQRLSELYLKIGDAILFKRGDTFRFGESLQTRNCIIYGSYGEGVKPKIYGSPENYAESDKWENESENIWKIPFDYPEACGLVINHSQLVGIKKVGSVDNLAANGDYLHDTESGVFYLYCDKGNPSEVYHDIEIMPSINIFSAVGCSQMVTVDNLCIKYSAGFGIHAVNAADFNVTNCEFGFLGGKWTDPETKNLRYGNAVEFWEGGIDIKVENNWFYQTFDSALTWQGESGKTYSGISFSGNLFEYNNADIEFFENGATLENFSIKNNIMRFTSLGWGTRADDGGIRGIEGCIRGVTGSHPSNSPTKVVSVYFTDNIIDCPSRQIINWNIDPGQNEFIHASGTRLYIKSEYRSLKQCLQGLQTKKWQFYNRKFSTSAKKLKKDFKLFEEGAKIYWDEK